MSFTWSSTFTVGAPIDFKGDKVILPQKALEAIIQAHTNAPPPPPPEADPNYDPTSWANPPARTASPFLHSNSPRSSSPYSHQHHQQQQQQRNQDLPSPLTFQIRNPANRLVTHGGVKEFSAEDGQVHLPHWMMSSLALSPGDQIMIKFLTLLKGTWAKFRPLSMDYLEILDFRSAFEAFLRSNYTTLTKGEILTIEQGRKEFRFVVEELKPGTGEAVCITDTDLEVDIEPLEEDLLKHQQQLQQQGGAGVNRFLGRGMKDQVLKIGVQAQGLVEVEDYQRWKIDVPVRNAGLKVTLTVPEPGDLDLLVSTKSPVTLQDHIWADFETAESRTLIIPVSDNDYANQPDFTTLHFGIYGRTASSSSSSSSRSSSAAAAPAQEVNYSILVEYHNDNAMDTSDASVSAASTEVPNQNAPGYQECTNCGAWIPERTMMLHSNFCMRNNVKCNKCGDVMKKEELANHFHCDHCDKHGHIAEKKKHEELFHGWYQCACETFESADLPSLALHRRTSCPDRFIICRYCHTLVQQGKPSSNSRDRIRGLLSHESYCGDRTIPCQRCQQNVSLKDVQVHMQHHEYQRQNQSTPTLCSNQNCVRPKATSPANVLGLCQLCFGPYWVPTEDPKHQKLVQRLARRYHAQLMSGCGNSWCRNLHCATAKGVTMDATGAATEMMLILKEAKLGSKEGGKTWLCVDEGITRRKVLAELLFEDMKGQYAIEWCVKALEADRSAVDLEAAVQWLNQQAPKRPARPAAAARS